MDNIAQVNFSLILCTINRVAELENFFKSLARQTYHSFECILVDQNEDNLLEPLVRQYQGQFSICYLQCEKGLSYARNRGLEHARGEILAFPDDDCWYADDLLEKAASLLLQHPEWDGITGISNSGQEGTSVWRWDSSPGFIDRYNVWKRGISISIFLRKRVLSKVGKFDNELGLGAKTLWQSGEETDLLIRAIDQGMKIYYSPHLIIFHPDTIPDFKKMDYKKVYGYGAGMGHVLKKQRYPFSFVFWQLIRPMAGVLKAVISLDFDRVKYHQKVFQGRIEGWWNS